MSCRACRRGPEELVRSPSNSSSTEADLGGDRGACRTARLEVSESRNAGSSVLSEGQVGEGRALTVNGLSVPKSRQRRQHADRRRRLSVKNVRLVQFNHDGLLDGVGDRATCRNRLETGDLEQAALHFGLVTVPVLLLLLRQSLEELLGDEVLYPDQTCGRRKKRSVRRL